MSEKMTSEQYKTFLMEGTRTGKLATTRKDGRPHVVPIWFVLDGDEVVFTTGATSVKGHALKRDGGVSMCVDDQEPPYSFVTVEGQATISSDLGEILTWATRIAERYVGAERAEDFGRRNAVEGELLVRFAITNVLARQGVTS